MKPQPGQIYYDVSDYIPGYGQVTVSAVSAEEVTFLAPVDSWFPGRGMKSVTMSIWSFMDRFSLEERRVR